MAIDVSRSRLVVHGLAITSASMHRNESIIPDAARSCTAVFTSSGTSPTIARCPPKDAMSATSTRAACRRAWTTVSRRARMSANARRTRAAKTTNIVPDESDPRLKTVPEKSRWVPSSLKWRCHQVLSLVVAMAIAVPSTSSVTDAIAKCWASARGGVPPAPNAESGPNARRGLNWIVEDIGPPMCVRRSDDGSHSGRTAHPDRLGCRTPPGGDGTPSGLP